MSRNGSGGYSLPSNGWNPATNGVGASAADWQALINDVATAIQQSVSADGQTPITGNLQMGGNKLTGLAAGSGTGQSLRYEQLFSQGTLTNIASAATMDIGAQLTNFLRVTGTTTITSFGTNYNGPKFLIFASAVTLTNSASLVLPGGANITTSANDSIIVIPISSGWQVVAYQLSAGLQLNVSSINSGQIAGHRNKIINPFTINQRALTSVADDVYCLDRWYALTETGNVTIAQITDPESGAPFAIRLTQPEVTAKRIGIATIIESKDIRQYRNAAMNFAARVKPSFSGNVRYAILEHTGTADTVTSDVVNNWASVIFTASNFFISGLNVLKTGTVAPGAATYGDLSDWSALGASTNNIILFVWTESAQAQGATLELNRPQYEPGVVRTPQEWRLNELQLCQRFYCKSFDTALGTPPGDSGAIYSDTNNNTTTAFNVNVSIRFPVAMRSMPSFIATRNPTLAWGATDWRRSDNTSDVSTIVFAASSQGFSVRLTSLAATQWARGHYEADAEM